MIVWRRRVSDAEGRGIAHSSTALRSSEQASATDLAMKANVS